MFMIILSAQHHDQLLPVLRDAASLATPYLTSFAGMQKAQMCLSIHLSEYVSDSRHHRTGSSSFRLHASCTVCTRYQHRPYVACAFKKLAIN